jgi:hypothetical protein
MSVQSVFYLAAWNDFNQERVTSSLRPVRVDEIIFILTAGMVLLLLSEPTAYDFFGKIGTIQQVLIYLTGFWGVFTFFLYGFDVFLSWNRFSIIKLAPLLMMNVNFLFWTQSEVFAEQKIWVFLTNSILGCLISFKFKVFAAAKENFSMIHVEILVHTVFLVLETVLKVIPKYPTFLLLVVFTCVRYFSLVFSVTRQVEGLFKQLR